MKDEYKEIINLAIDVSSAALIKFFQKINLDLNGLKEINSLNLKFGDTIGAAKYDAKTELITLNPKEMYKILRHYDNAKAEEKKSTKTNVILEIATSIIHEKIHALRTIPIPPDSVNLPYLVHIPEELAKREIFRFQGKDYIVQTDEFIETKAVACDIIQDSNYLTDLEEIPDFNNINENTLYQYLMTEIIPKKRIECQKQGALEECITEALAQIIIFNFIPKNTILPVDQLADKVIKINSDRDDAIIGAKVIKACDDNIIPWFLTTRFNMPYEDLFAQTFLDKYDSLLDNINRIYIAACNKDFPQAKDIERVDQILNTINNHDKTI